VTRGAIYHHYGSRLGVFSAVHAQAQAQVAEAIIRATEALTDPWEALLVGCRAYLDAAVRDDIRQILLLDAPAVLGWHAWRELDAQNSGRLLAEALTDLVRDQVIRVDSVSACHALLSGAMNDAALWAASLDDATVGADEAWAVLIRMLHALRA
jgi:AcrR family transcriptional regulator